MVSVSAGGNVLATYTYASGNGKLTRMTYGNGDYEDYTYDNLDRLAKVTYNGSTADVFTVLYDSNGRLAKAVDGKAGIAHLYEYDSLGRLIRAYQKDSSGNTIFAVENSYDSYGRPTGSTYVIDGTSRTYSIAYKANTNLVSQYNTPGAGFSYNYDSFDRLTSKSNTLFGYTYAYQVNTTLVSSLTVSTNAASTSDVYSYTYNTLGNITSVKKNGTTIASYGYDALGQLTSETNTQSGEIYVYTYDKAGNITKKEVYTGNIGNLTDTINYTYSTSAWGDLLTNYDGTAITYDSIGNPTNWGDAIALNWDGRNLVKTVFASNNYVNYTYNADGIRTRKYEYNGTGQYYNDHTYVLDGNTIVKEIIVHSSAASGNSTTTLEYYYDDSGIVSVNYNGTLYHYIKNLQGDVIGIVNSSSGAFVVEYTYDAWGNILSVTGSMASTLGQYNPFRYRGYYYDSEIALYYLNSRYYDPQVGRFINADGIVGANGGLQGYNMFAYCNNNPVMFVDHSGMLATSRVAYMACYEYNIGYNTNNTKKVFDYPEADDGNYYGEDVDLLFSQGVTVHKNISHEDVDYWYEQIKKDDYASQSLITLFLPEFLGQLFSLYEHINDSVYSPFVDPEGRILYIEEGYTIVIIDRVYVSIADRFSAAESEYFVYDKQNNLVFNKLVKISRYCG